MVCFYVLSFFTPKIIEMMLQVNQQILKKTGWNYQLYSWFSIAPFDGTNNFSLHVETQKRALLSTDTPPNANDFEGVLLESKKTKRPEVICFAGWPLRMGEQEMTWRLNISYI